MKLIDQYRKMHKTGRFTGFSLKKHVKSINNNIWFHRISSILDYGCGKGMYHKHLKIKPVRYDPGVIGLDRLPNGPFDMVICTDVLEHIPEDELDDTLEKIFSRATKFVYLSISTRLSNKNLPNGDNCHCTVRTEKWWEEKINKFDKPVSINFD